MSDGQKNVPPVDSKEDTKEKPKKPVANILSLKKEMDDFKEEVKQTNNKILGALESIMNKDERKAPDVGEEKEEEKDSEIIELTKQQREIFEYYFDPADGFKANYDINKNIFTIEVPVKLSNTTPAHRALYHDDKRSKKVDPNNILGSIKSWCILVQQNLKYEPRIKLK